MNLRVNPRFWIAANHPDDLLDAAVDPAIPPNVFDWLTQPAEDAFRPDGPLTETMIAEVRNLVATFSMFHDSESWGIGISWIFAVADYLTHEGYTVPAEWEFRPGAFGPDTDTIEYQELVEAHPSEEAIQRFGALLWRVRERLKDQGLDY